VRQAEADAGQRPEQLTSAEREELRRPREENSELKRANEMLALGDTKQQVERIAACN
jgi:transposase